MLLLGCSYMQSESACEREGERERKRKRKTGRKRQAGRDGEDRESAH
jgi:hypothetical protein